jgi:hypothetical protein
MFVRFTEFLQIILRDICTKRSDLKLILMSATMHTHKIREYFGNIPEICVGGSVFPVQEYYLEHVLQCTRFMAHIDSRNALLRGAYEHQEHGQGRGNGNGRGAAVSVTPGAAKTAHTSHAGATGHPAHSALPPDSRFSHTQSKAHAKALPSFLRPPEYFCSMCEGGPFQSALDLGAHSACCYPGAPAPILAPAPPPPPPPAAAPIAADAATPSATGDGETTDAAPASGQSAEGGGNNKQQQQQQAHPKMSQKQPPKQQQPMSRLDLLAAQMNSIRLSSNRRVVAEEEYDEPSAGTTTTASATVADADADADADAGAHTEGGESDAAGAGMALDGGSSELLQKYQNHWDDSQVDCDLIYALLRYVFSEEFPHQRGSVLVFLPGWDDISRMMRMLQSSEEFHDAHKYVLLQLHSGIQKRDQDLVFQPVRRGAFKIILSTNIAETSITIDDVTVVINTGRVKEMTYDPHTKLACLQSSWVSQASARQRRGRAGRTQTGVCFHLYSALRSQNLSEFQDSELLRMPLEELVLQVRVVVAQFVNVNAIVIVVKFICFVITKEPVLPLLFLLIRFCIYYRICIAAFVIPLTLTFVFALLNATYAGEEPRCCPRCG